MASQSPPRAPSHQGLPTWVLGGVLSLVLLGLWAIYLTLAPVPVPRLPEQAAAPAPAPGELRVLAWRGLLPPDVTQGFARDTGLAVAVETYDSLGDLQTRAAAGLAYDLILVPGLGLARLGSAGALRDARAFALANRAKLDPALVAAASVYDPEGRHGVLAAWGTLGLAYDPAKVAARLGDGPALQSWSLLFDPAHLSRLADCGVQILDAQGAFPIALRYLGLPANSETVEDTEAATHLWESVRPSIARFGTANVADGLASGAVCLSVATSGDVFQARQKVRAAGEGPRIHYVLPTEGALAWFAFLAIPQASIRPDDAGRFIDYVLRPEVAARLTNATGAANPVTDATLYVRPEIKTDPALQPPSGSLSDFIIETDAAPEVAALRERFWQLVSTPPAPPEPPAPEPTPAPAPPTGAPPAEAPPRN